MDELGLIRAWLYAVLSGDATLIAMIAEQPDEVGNPGVFSGKVKKGAIFPVIVFRWLGPLGDGDTYVNGNRRSWTRALYRVMINDQREDFEALSPASKQIDALLSIDNAVAVSGGSIMDCVRTQPFEGSLIESGQEFRQLGGDYAIKAQAL